MNQIRIYSLGILLFIVVTSCKKVEPEKEWEFTGCKPAFSHVSNDTNYIPHKKKNYWGYCNETGAWPGWSASITLDTVIGSKIHFERVFSFSAAHSGNGAGTPLVGDQSTYYIIDSTGNYYFVNYNSSISASPDTVLFIMPMASNGDTIYNNTAAKVKVVLVNKSETFYSISDCYHSRVILNAYSSDQKIVDRYFKKGIGEVYFTEKIGEQKGEILSYATIK